MDWVSVAEITKHWLERYKVDRHLTPAQSDEYVVAIRSLVERNNGLESIVFWLDHVWFSTIWPMIRRCNNNLLCNQKDQIWSSEIHYLSGRFVRTGLKIYINLLYVWHVFGHQTGHKLRGALYMNGVRTQSLSCPISIQFIEDEKWVFLNNEYFLHIVYRSKSSGLPYFLRILLYLWPKTGVEIVIWVPGSKVIGPLIKIHLWRAYHWNFFAFFRACFKGMVTLKIWTEIRTIGVDFECERTLNDHKVLPGKEPIGHSLVVRLEICVALQPSRSIVAPVTNVF